MSMTQARRALPPLLVAAVAFVLWWISDRLLYVGPLDRATFGWLVVMPLWAAAPTIAGFSWRGDSARSRTWFAAFGGLAIGGVAAAILWSGVTTPVVGCTPTHTPIELLPSATMVGALVGGAFFIACRVTSGEVAAGHVGRGAIYGAVIQLVVVPVAAIVFSTAFFGMCQRP